MNEREILIRVRISRRTVVWAVAALLMCCAANEVVSESLTMTTYYPAPSGTYLGLVTTGAAGRNTILARDSGRVGIGTANPRAALEISSTNSGLLPPRMTTAQRDAIASPPIGSVLFNTTANELEVYTGTWGAPVASSAGLYTVGGHGRNCIYPNPSTHACSCPGGTTGVVIAAWDASGTWCSSGPGCAEQQWLCH